MDTVMRYSSSLVFKPALNFAANVAPYRQLDKTPAALNYFQGNGNVFMPLWGKFFYSEEFEKPKIIQLSANLGGAYTRLNTNSSVLNFNHPLINMNLGLNFFWFNGKRSAITAGSFAFTNEDNITISNPRIRYTGYVQWRYSFSKKFALRLGSTFSYLLGQGIPLPILGLNWRVSPKLLFNLNFPFNANLNWTPTRQTLFRVFVQPNGGVSTFGNAKADLGTKSDVVVIRRREYKLGLSYLQYINGKFNFTLEAGLLVARRIILTPPNRNNDIAAGLNRTDKREFNNRLDPAPYISLGLGYRFGKIHLKKKIVKPKTDESLLDIPSDFSADDIQGFGQLDLGSINMDVQPLNIDAIDKFDLNEDDFRELKTQPKQ